RPDPGRDRSGRRDGPDPAERVDRRKGRPGREPVPTRDPDPTDTDLPAVRSTGRGPDPPSTTGDEVRTAVRPDVGTGPGRRDLLTRRDPTVTGSIGGSGHDPSRVICRPWSVDRRGYVTADDPGPVPVPTRRVVTDVVPSG